MGPFRVCRAVLPQMRAQRRGLIIHVTSIAGRLLFPGCALYCASKFAHEAFAEVLNYELTGTGVESVIVEPGPIPLNCCTTVRDPRTPNAMRSTETYLRFATISSRISRSCLPRRMPPGRRTSLTRFCD